MKKIYITLFFFSVIGANAQIGVNTPLPQSTLEVKATSQASPTALDGLLIPRVDKFTNTDPGQDQHSMIVFLTKEITYKTKLYAIGYYYWDATKTDWIKFTDANTLMPEGWLTEGNVVDDDAFFGTTNDKDIIIKRDNLLYGKWQRDNVSLGFESMLNNRALSNTAMGYRTLYTNTTGEKNTAIGFSALWFNTTGSSNLALGDTALAGNTTSNGNVAIGNNALKQFTGGTGNSYNTAVGYNVLTMNKDGHYNTAVGSNALQVSLAGKNTAIGANALNENTAGTNNIGIGIASLKGNKAGSNNIHIGNADANTGRDNIENTIVIGNNVGDGSILDNTIFIGGPNMQYFITNTQMGVYSDKRFKEESKQQVPGLAFITKLRPVTYYWDYDKLNKFKGVTEKNTLPQKLETGFMAQEVEQAAKDINYDFSGVNIPENANTTTYTLKYAEFVVPLVQAVKELNEKNKQLESENNSLRQEFEALKKLVQQKLKN